MADVLGKVADLAAVVRGNEVLADLFVDAGNVALGDRVHEVILGDTGAGHSALPTVVRSAAGA
jgi:hypothetical protein